MTPFDDIDDVQDWLEPVGYEALWRAVAPYNVFTSEDREHCDGLVASGTVPKETILTGLKTMVRLELTDRFGLKHRIYEPVDRQYLMTTH